MQAAVSNLSLPTFLQNIFAWCGAKSNILERNKARDLALAIRDSERQGKAQVEIVTDGEEPADMIQVERCCGRGRVGGGGSSWKPLRVAVISWGHEGGGWRAVGASGVAAQGSAGSSAESGIQGKVAPRTEGPGAGQVPLALPTSAWQFCADSLSHGRPWSWA